jgi:hypothetical protein
MLCIIELVILLNKEEIDKVLINIDHEFIPHLFELQQLSNDNINNNKISIPCAIYNIEEINSLKVIQLIFDRYFLKYVNYDIQIENLPSKLIEELSILELNSIIQLMKISKFIGLELVYNICLKIINLNYIKNKNASFLNGAFSSHKLNNENNNNSNNDNSNIYNKQINFIKNFKFDK